MTKPEHSHGKYYTSSTHKPGPTDTLSQAIARFEPENLTVRESTKGALVVEEKETNLTVWSSRKKVSHNEVMKLLKRIGLGERWGGE